MANENIPKDLSAKKPQQESAGDQDAYGRWQTTESGEKYVYSPFEQKIALSLSAYLMAAMIFVFWFILDVWSARFGFVKWIMNAENLPSGGEGLRLLRLVLFGIAGGWMGGTISAMRSLQFHYASPVRNIGDKEKQDKTRFHVNWWMRWFWGPWIGAGLAFVVIALVRSGVLVFASSASQTGSVSATENFATFGLGGLVGLSSKDVVEKLINTLKKWLRAEEPEVQEINVKRDGEGEVFYGGEVVIFRVDPRIPVTWSIEPPSAGTITNGFFRPAEKPAEDTITQQHVVVTATSKADTDRSASGAITVKKR